MFFPAVTLAAAAIAQNPAGPQKARPADASLRFDVDTSVDAARTSACATSGWNIFLNWLHLLQSAVSFVGG
jgi:hypothetical protein